MKIEIYPLEKVVIDGASVCLGMSKSAVEGAIGKGESVGTRYFYYDSEMAIDYDANDAVEFIEFLGGIDGELKPVIYGVSAFDVLADELYKVLKKHNDGDIEDTEQGYSYVFMNISVGICREAVPSDVEELAEELKADGESVDGNEELEEEMRKATHWATIGIGVAGYYD